MLKRNPNAIHIGLTATPRQLQQSKKATAEDREITANNLKYFGEPVYAIELPEFALQQQASAALAALKPMRRTIEFKMDEINLLPQKILARAFGEIQS